MTKKLKNKLMVVVSVIVLVVCGGFTTYKAVEKYSVTYDLNGGEFTSENVVNTVRYVDEVETPEATKEHYIFKGWTDGNDIMTTIKHARNNVFLTAVYSPEVYGVTFKDGDTVVSSTNYTYGTGVSDLSLFAKANASNHPYEDFACWKDAEGKEYKSLSETEFGNKVLTASYTGKTYEITYDLYDGTADELPESYKYGTGIESLPDASKDGKIFDGWYSDEEYTKQVTSISSDSHEDIYLYAKYHDKPVTATGSNRRNYSFSGSSYSSSSYSTTNNASYDYSNGITIPKLGYHVDNVVWNGGQDSIDAENTAVVSEVTYCEWIDKETGQVLDALEGFDRYLAGMIDTREVNYLLVLDHAYQGLSGAGWKLSAGDVLYLNGTAYTYSGMYNISEARTGGFSSDELSKCRLALRTCTEDNSSDYFCLFY